jgi:hypothetical protein
MKMRLLRIRRPVAVVAAAIGICIGGSSNAAQYHTAEIVITVEAWPGKIWDYFRFFCEGRAFMGDSSTCIVGGGGPGSIRVLGDGSKELLLSVGEFSHTYEAIEGPLAELDFHVTLQAEALEDPLRSTITATLIWDDEPIPESERLAAQYRFTSIVRGALVTAKGLAEAS